MGLPESPDYVTMAGLLLQRLGAFPKGGGALSLPPYTITVVRIEGHRIARVRVDRDAHAD